MASDILSYNVVQDHEGISIKGYRGLRPPGDLIYSQYEYLTGPEVYTRTVLYLMLPLVLVRVLYITSTIRRHS